MYFTNYKDPYQCNLYFDNLPEDHIHKSPKGMSPGEGNCETLVKEKTVSFFYIDHF